MKNATLLGWGAVLCGLIGMIYTIYHDTIWGRYEGWSLFATKSHIAIALCAVAIIVGAKLLTMGERKRAG